MDHAKAVPSKVSQEEVGPARWKVLLSMPIIIVVAWWAVSTAFSGNALWLWNFFVG